MHVELYFAHGLRQGPSTLSTSSFGVHQDTEEFPFIEHTVVVKLTADAPDEPPSRMRVLGAARPFAYGAEAGAAGSFLARLHHASIPPKSDQEHFKVAFFYRIAADVRPTATVSHASTVATAAATAPAAAAAAAAATSPIVPVSHTTTDATSSPTTVTHTSSSSCAAHTKPTARASPGTRTNPVATAKRTVATSRATTASRATFAAVSGAPAATASSRRQVQPPPGSECKCGAQMVFGPVDAAGTDTIECDGGCGYSFGRSESCWSCLTCDLDLCQQCSLKVFKRRAAAATRLGQENSLMQLCE